MCRSSWNLGVSTSWNTQGLSRAVKGLLYLYLMLWTSPALNDRTQAPLFYITKTTDHFRVVCISALTRVRQITAILQSYLCQHNLINRPACRTNRFANCIQSCSHTRISHIYFLQLASFSEGRKNSARLCNATSRVNIATPQPLLKYISLTGNNR